MAVKKKVAAEPDFFEFYEHMQKSVPHRPLYFRAGQYVFYCLNSIRPDIVKKIAGGEVDIFYWSTEKWWLDQGKFWEHVIELWEVKDF